MDGAVEAYDEPPPDKSRLVELRAGGGGRGAQTIFPGSVHKDTGEPIEWEPGCDRDPAVVDGDALRRRVAMCAALTLISRKWPDPDSHQRHDAALTLGGFLSRAGLTAIEVEVAAEAVARAAGDSEWRDRRTAAKDHAEHHAKIGKGRGFPELKNIVGDDAAKRIAEWLAYKHGTSAQRSGVSLDDFHAYMPMHSYIFAPAREMWPAGSINQRIAPIIGADGKEIKPSTWLDQNKPVEQMTWQPGAPMLIPDRLISDGGWIERKGVTCFNLYKPPTIKAGDPGLAGPWLDHVKKVFPEDAGHIVKWLAHRVQQPEVKPNHALVLGGNQGTGKDTLLEPVKHAIGPWNFAEVTPQHMLGRFNGFVRSVILRISEARDLGDINRFAFYDHMKTYTASPPDVLRCDEKNLREYSVFNVCGVIITTNHKADGIFLPADDRRHYVAWSDLKKENFADNYWNKLWGFYAAGGTGHVAEYLATLDLSGFDPKAPPPKTPAFWDIVDANRAPEDAELADVLDRLGNPDATILAWIANEADGDFQDWLKDRKNRRAIPHRLEQCEYVPVRNDAAKDGLWVIGARRQVVYARASLPLRERIRAARQLADR